MSTSTKTHLRALRRTSLSWPPAPSSICLESSGVDVFSLELGKYFLDLRVYNNASGPSGRKGEVDWAMAGVRQVLDGSTEEKTKLRFITIISSRTPHPSPIPPLSESESFANPEETESPLNTSTPDDVVIQPLAQGSSVSDSNPTYLESGCMPNPTAIPASDEYVPFEETWEILPLQTTTSSSSSEPGATSKAFLMESLTADTEEGGKAYFAQLGRYRLALSDPCDGTGSGNGFHGWLDDFDGASSEWIEVKSISEASRKVIKSVGVEEVLERAVEGQVIQWGGREWVVRVRTAVGRGE